MSKAKASKKSKSPVHTKAKQPADASDNQSVAGTHQSSVLIKRPAGKDAKPTAGSEAGSSTKQDQVVAMLRAKGGTTIAAIMKATGWQKHSVHGFLAGVVRKKLKLNLVSEKVEGTRTYAIGKDQRAKAKGAGSGAGRHRAAHGKKTRKPR